AQGEKFGYEITAGVWPLNSSGNVLSHGITTDFRSDLGITGRAHPLFKGVVKLAEKHAVTVEFVPYRLDGKNTLTHDVHFNGRTYTAQDTIHWEANVNYVFGGYQYQLVGRDRGQIELVA